MLFLRKRTEPSPNAKLEPPGCRLMNPLADDPNRQPTGAVADCHVLLLQGPRHGHDGVGVPPERNGRARVSPVEASRSYYRRRYWAAPRRP